jgi:hypothetical protein
VPVVPGTIKIVFSINFLHFILAQTLLKNSGKISKKYFPPRKAGTKPKVLNKTEHLSLSQTQTVIFGLNWLFPITCFAPM